VEISYPAQSIVKEW